VHNDERTQSSQAIDESLAMNASERFDEDGRGWETRVLFAGDVNVKSRWYPGPDLPRLELQDQATILYDTAIGRVGGRTIQDA
jgi:hypothetical protein